MSDLDKSAAIMAAYMEKNESSGSAMEAINDKYRQVLNATSD